MLMMHIIKLVHIMAVTCKRKCAEGSCAVLHKLSKLHNIKKYALYVIDSDEFRRLCI